MTRIFIWRAARLLLVSLIFAAVFIWAAPGALGQDAPQTPSTPPAQTPAPTTQTPAPAKDVAPADQPLYTEFKGLKLGATRDEARKRLGTPQQKDDTQDFFVFSDRERARVYYDNKGVVSAVIVTYIGKSGDVPTPKAILGSEVEPKQDGSMYSLVQYPKAGYWVAYSRTTGDEPLTIITMQKMN
jgi:hypothetical protein